MSEMAFDRGSDETFPVIDYQLGRDSARRGGPIPSVTSAEPVKHPIEFVLKEVPGGWQGNTGDRVMPAVIDVEIGE